MNLRKPLIAGNWKMNVDHLEAIALVQQLAFSLPKKISDEVDIAVIPPFTDLRSVQTLVESDSLPLRFGAQDLSAHDKGAYTGEISGEFLAKLKCTYVLVGHSERRQYHNETDDLVAAKTAKALEYGLKPIVCIGESETVRESGKHIAFNQQQLTDSLAGIDSTDINQIVIAYEPVWAIGTGKVASSADAEEVCAAIRNKIAELYSQEVADKIVILYGGSVKSDSIAELMSKPNIDGALVGGASLKPNEFSDIITKSLVN